MLCMLKLLWNIVVMKCCYMKCCEIIELKLPRRGMDENMLCKTHENKAQ